MRPIESRVDGAVFRRLVGECLQTPGRIAGAVGCMLALSASQLYLTWIAKRWVEEGLAAHDSAAIVRLMALAAGVSAAMVLALFGSSYLLAAVNQSLVATLRERAERRLLGARLAAVRGFAGGDLLSRAFNDSSAVSGFAESLLKRVIGEGFLVVGAVTMMLYLEWRLALAALVTAPLLAWLVTRLGRVIRQRGSAAQKELGSLSALLAEQIAGFTTIKSFQAEDFEAERFVARSRSYQAGVMRSEWWSSALLASVWLLASFGLLFVVAYGSELVISRRLTEGAVLSFCLYAIQTIEPVRRIGEVYGRMQRTLAAAERVYEIVDLPWVEDEGGKELAPPVRGALRLERLSFAYQPGKPILDDVTLEVSPGEMTAVVAASGGGKSTLAALVARFYDPTAGRLLVDGIDLRELRLGRLRRAVCVVEQQPFVFEGTLYDNARYGSWQASRTEVESAIAAAGLGGWLAQMPRGLETPLAEGGSNLSGGQKQRVALARAIVRDPRILILDEATSALDGEIEAQIYAEIRPWLSRRTVLVMAHRFSTVSLCSRAVVLVDGRVVGDGPVESLRFECPAFAQLFADQLRPARVEAERTALSSTRS